MEGEVPEWWETSDADKRIGLVLANGKDWFNGRTLSGVQSEIRAYGYRLEVAVSEDDLVLEK